MQGGAGRAGRSPKPCRLGPNPKPCARSGLRWKGVGDVLSGPVVRDGPGRVRSRKGGREAYGSGSENQRGETHRGFESHPFRRPGSSMSWIVDEQRIIVSCRARGGSR